MKVKIRFNTENTTDLYWRLIIDGVERTVRTISINVPTYTTQDELPNGKVKFHMTCINAKDVSYANEGKDAVIK